MNLGKQIGVTILTMLPAAFVPTISNAQSGPTTITPNLINADLRAVAESLVAAGTQAVVEEGVQGRVTLVSDVAMTPDEYRIAVVDRLRDLGYGLTLEDDVIRIGADGHEECYEAEPTQMPEDERLRITLSLLERYPELASSPGVKAAYTSPSCPGVSSTTSVIYYPHTENRGVKEAFEALCSRTYPETIWTCDHVVTRRYLRLGSQDFEVRLRGDLTAEAAMALIEASRRDMQAMAGIGNHPDTAIIILPRREGGYLITWGTPEGRSRLTMLAELSEGGDANNPDDWHANAPVK